MAESVTNADFRPVGLVKRSEYLTKLSLEAKKRFESKTLSAGLDIDPYVIEEWTQNPEDIPKVRWSDVVLYMVSTPSPYTKEAIKAWKGMVDSAGFVKAGWVHDMLLHCFSDSKFVIKGKVKHSQRMSATSLIPWAILEKEGTILACHCTCMAELGEACSHIAALLSCLVAAVESREKAGTDSVTSQSCKWLPPANNVTPANISDIKFVNPANIMNKPPAPATKPSDKPERMLPADEFNQFIKDISQADQKPGILKVIKPYADDFIPKAFDSKLPQLITSLYSSEALHQDYPTILTQCETAFHTIKVTAEEITHLEAATRGQSSNKIWNMFRAGRITASVMKSVVQTDNTMPSQSLIKRICYPEAFKFSTVATRWGCSHEKCAVEDYKQAALKHHQGLTVEEAGLFVHPDMPFIGASPDRIITCECCGKGALEVKCPFCAKDGLPDCEDKNFCMELKEDKWVLKQNHQYYYQVQTQLYVCRLTYADFVVWTENGMAYERISFDDKFFEVLLDTLKRFFIYGVLPEIIGKWYSRKPIAGDDGIVVYPVDSRSSDESDKEDYEKLWCFCGQPSYGRMILCDNDCCPIQWFHCDCLRIRGKPKGKWFCPSCSKQKDKGKKKKVAKK